MNAEQRTFLDRIQGVWMKIEAGTDTIYDYDDIIKRVDGGKTLAGYMNAIVVENDTDPQQVSLLLPEINHHKLNYGDETYITMKKEIKRKMMSKSFDRTFHVMPMEVSDDNTPSEEFPIPLFSNGKKPKSDMNEPDGYAKFVDNTTDSSIAPLDGQHRSFAMAEVMAAETSSNWTQDIECSLVFYIPLELNMTNEEYSAFLRCMPGLSRKIAEEREKSLNTTLIDALETVAKMNEENIVFMSDFYARTNANGDQIWKMAQKDYQEIEQNEPKMLGTVEFLYKTLTKSHDFLDSFKSKWSKFRDNDFQTEFWRTDIPKNFLTTTAIKKYFTTEQKMIASKMFTKIKKRSEFKDKMEKDQNSIRVDYRAYCIAQTLEPVFFHRQYKHDMIKYLGILRGSNLVTTHRLMYIATLAYVTATRIIEGWLTYDPFMEGTLENELCTLEGVVFNGLKNGETKNQPMSTRRPVIKKCFFTYIVKSLFQLYSNFEKVQSLDDEDKRDLMDQLKRNRHADAITKAHENDPLNLSLELAELASKYEENSNKERKERDDNEYCMDLLALRYVGFLRILLMRNGPHSPHTLQFHLALLRGEKIDSFLIPGVMNLFDLEGKSRHLSNIYNVFRNGELKMFADQNLDIPQEEEHKIYVARRKKWFISYMLSRFGRLITTETWESLRKVKDKSCIQFTATQKFNKLFYDGTSFIDSVLNYFIPDEEHIKMTSFKNWNDDFWWNPLDIYKFLKSKPTEKDETLGFFEDIPDREIGDENKELLVAALPHKEVNVEFSEYLKRYADWIKGEKKQWEKSKPDESESVQKEDEEEEDQTPSWDDIHKEYFRKYKKRTGLAQDRFVSNLINVAICGFAKKTQTPTLKKVKKKKVWILTGEIESSSEVQFSELVRDNMKIHFKDLSKNGFFSNQDVLTEFESKEKEKQRKDNKVDESSKVSPEKPFDPQGPDMQRMIMTTLQTMQQMNPYAMQMNPSNIQRHPFRQHHLPQNMAAFPYMQNAEEEPDHPVVLAQRQIKNQKKRGGHSSKKTSNKRERENSDDHSVKRTKKPKKTKVRRSSRKNDTDSDSNDEQSVDHKKKSRKSSAKRSPTQIEIGSDTDNEQEQNDKTSDDESSSDSSQEQEFEDSE